MNKVNYNSETEKIISANKKARVKPALMMHACCAPCASVCVERVKDFFDLTVFFFNPNIDGEDEYNKRLNETERLCAAMDVKFTAGEYAPEVFYAAAKGLEDAPEGGERCAKCFYLRLKKTAEKAKAAKCEYFTTTLTLSPLKNAALINEIGARVAKETGVRWLPSDFKKRGGYQRSVELSRELGLYRQNYCGCAFSKNKNPNF